MDDTSIRVSRELANELYMRKGQGTSYEEFIWSLLATADRDAGDEQDQEPEPTPDESASGNVSSSDEPATLDDVEFPNHLDRADCLRAIEAARDYLRENGPASMRVLVREVMPSHPLGYDVPDLSEGERYRGAWWRRVVKPGLEALPDVEPPAPGASDWQVK